MADKTPTITTPVSNDVIHFTVRCDGAGKVTSFVGSLTIATGDASLSHDGGVACDVSSLPAAATDAIATLISQALTEYKAQKGF